MTSVAIQISGATIGQGVKLGGSAFSFTLTSSDFAAGGSGGGVPTFTTAGFTVAGSPHLSISNIVADLGSGNGVSNTYYTQLYNDWLAAGLDTSHSYAFDVAWTGGSPGSTEAFVSFYHQSATSGSLTIAPVSTANDQWKLPLDLTSLYGANGTYNFPATFTLRLPKVQDGTDWC